MDFAKAKRVSNHIAEYEELKEMIADLSTARVGITTVRIPARYIPAIQKMLESDAELALGEISKL